MNEEKRMLPGPAGQLELVLEENEATDPPYFMVIAHPHPLFGGTMNNKVVTTLAKVGQHFGWPTIRFNFRGVGQSEGQYDEGQGEQADLSAVLDWARLRWPSAKIILAGFSFGAYVSTALSVQEPPALLISIGPPVMRWGFAGITHQPAPWLVVQGLEDEVVPAPEVLAWFASQHPNTKVIAFPEAGHFFHGKLLALRELLIAEITRQLRLV